MSELANTAIWGKFFDANKSLMDHDNGFNLVLEKFVSVMNDLAERGVTSPVLEIGVNWAGTAKTFFDVLIEMRRPNWFITVDPYGAIPYHNGCGTHDVSVYTNERYRSSVALLTETARINQANYVHYKMSSEDFFQAFPCLKIYDDSKTYPLERFSFVYLDGSHDPEVVKKEVRFFASRLEQGGAIVIDDYEGGRFHGFWEEFLNEHWNLCTNKTDIPQRFVLEYKNSKPLVLK